MNFNILFIFILILIGASIFERKFSRSLSILIYLALSILLSIIFALRTLDSPDTIDYLNAFQHIDIYTNWFKRGLYDFETGFVFISQVFKVFIGNNHEAYFFLIAISGFILLLFISSSIQRIFKAKTPHFLSTLALYTTYFGIYYQAIALRAGLAILFLSLAVFCFVEKKRLVSLILLIIAFLLHDSAIIILLIIPILFIDFKLSKRTYRVILIFVLLVGITNILGSLTTIIINFLKNNLVNVSFFNVFYSYLIKDIFATRVSIKFLFYIMIGFYVTSFGNDNKSNRIVLNIFILGLVFYSIFGRLGVYSRAADFFNIYGILYLSIISISLNNNVSLNQHSSKVIGHELFKVLISLISFGIIITNLFI